MNQRMSSDLPVFSLIFRTSLCPFADESVPFPMPLSKLLKSQGVTSDVSRAHIHSTVQSQAVRGETQVRVT